ncbi:MAG: sulfite exporter TauE/SafE family protein [Bacillota bacterium]
MDALVELAYRWYTVMSQFSNLLGEPLQRLLGSQNIPGLSALLLGLLGGLAPCQVTANAGAIAYVTESSRQERPLWPTVGSFLLGKIVVYGTLGFLAAMIGWKLPIPAMVVLRKLSGPILILMGLYMLGWLRWRGPGGERLTEWIRQRMPRRGSPAFWLGVAFSLGFCPTMAMIFFGGLVPLVVQAQAGMVLAVVFAVGTAVPVILWAAALSAGREAGKRWVRQVRHADRYVRLVAATLFLLLGLNDVLLYWFI